MSGFVALFERRGDLASRASAEALLAQLAHRGADGLRVDVAGSVAFGHALFATTPEEQGALGARRLGDTWLVGDVRLDERPGLLSALGVAPEEANACTDGDLILRAYARWGERCAERLLGDFAWVLWDASRRLLLCARDALGVRPLYFHETVDGFRCASEPHALFGDGRVVARPSFDAMATYLASGYTERDATLWEGVRALEAGTSRIVTERATRRHVHWRPDPERRVRHRDDAAYAEHFGAVFADAVSARLRASGPVVAQVSGGLDSSSVAVQAEAERRRGVMGARALHFARLLFTGLPCDERVHSQAVADHLGVSLASIDVIARAPAPRWIAAAPDVYYDPTMRILEPLAHHARGLGARVMLTGVGGDQLMQPTEHHVASALLHGELGAAVRRASREATSPRGVARVLAAQALTAFAPRAFLRPFRRARRPPSERWPLLSRRAQAVAMQSLEATEAALARTARDPETAWMGGAITHSPSVSLALAVQDRASAHGGVELRHPFLDRRLVDFLLAIPVDQRVRGGETKGVLRRAMGVMLPTIVRSRTDKASFVCYVIRSLAEDGAEVLDLLKSNSRLVALGLVDGDALRVHLGETRDALPVASLLAFVSLELWLRSDAPVPASFGPAAPLCSPLETSLD